ncbi:MAG: hypothetical protein IPJ69_02355 [Deltaproteobacteria bacterium]|nr:MAG: hypothetical protein IPJ69_02355 [Deltaproteobacteria bacterium]
MHQPEVKRRRKVMRNNHGKLLPLRIAAYIILFLLARNEIGQWEIVILGLAIFLIEKFKYDTEIRFYFLDKRIESLREDLTIVELFSNKGQPLSTLQKAEITVKAGIKTTY